MILPFQPSLLSDFGRRGIQAFKRGAWMMPYVMCGIGALRSVVAGRDDVWSKIALVMVRATLGEVRPGAVRNHHARSQD